MPSIERKHLEIISYDCKGTLCKTLRSFTMVVSEGIVNKF